MGFARPGSLVGALVVSLARHLEPKMAPEMQAIEFERRPTAAQAARDVLLRRAGRSPAGPAGGTPILDNAITELINAWISVAADYRAMCSHTVRTTGC
jgi:hypothetical protein